MAYYEDIDLFVTSDRNHADVINEPLEKIIENIKDTRSLIGNVQTNVDDLEENLKNNYTATEQLNDLLATGIKGDNGKNLEFQWRDYELGVRQEGQDEYEFTYLRGEKGEAGDVSTEQLEQAIQEAKTELENEITNIPKVTKTSELTNDSGFITVNDIPEVDLEPYALKTEIPTTLPASDVYAWAKASTKPTYSASEVGALPSNGTAVNASKVNNLTVETAVPANAKFTDTNTWRGIQNNLTSTSTTESLSAYQGKVLNDELQNLKTTSVNGKQTVADAINGKCGTSLTSATTYADMAYYINNISTGAISKNYILATSGSITQKIKLAIIVFKGADESFTLEFASAMSGYIYYASNTGSTYDSRSSFTSTTTKLSKTVSNAMAIIVFDKPVAISSITCSSDCRGIFIY